MCWQIKKQPGRDDVKSTVLRRVFSCSKREIRRVRSCAGPRRPARGSVRLQCGSRSGFSDDGFTRRCRLDTCTVRLPRAAKLRRISVPHVWREWLGLPGWREARSREPQGTPAPRSRQPRRASRGEADADGTPHSGLRSRLRMSLHTPTHRHGCGCIRYQWRERARAHIHRGRSVGVTALVSAVSATAQSAHTR